MNRKIDDAAHLALLILCLCCIAYASFLWTRP
jgi:hypothetical protein